MYYCSANVHISSRDPGDFTHVLGRTDCTTLLFSSNQTSGYLMLRSNATHADAFAMPLCTRIIRPVLFHLSVEERLPVSASPGRSLYRLQSCSLNLSDSAARLRIADFTFRCPRRS